MHQLSFKLTLTTEVDIRLIVLTTLALNQKKCVTHCDRKIVGEKTAARAQKARKSLLAGKRNPMFYQVGFDPNLSSRLHPFGKTLRPVAPARQNLLSTQTCTGDQ